MSYSITPLDAMGGVVGSKTIAQLVTGTNTPQTQWVERLRLATDFITPDNTLICVADSPFRETVVNVTPIGLTQSFQFSESLPGMLAPEIGSRRKRPIVGNSQGGSLSISKMLCVGNSPLALLVAANPTMGLNADFWSEKAWEALIGLNHDKFRTAIGLVVIEGAPDGRSYSAYMFEQALIQGQSRGYQAGQHLTVDNLNLIYEQIVPLWGYGGDINYGTTI